MTDQALVLAREEAAQAALGQLPRHKVSLSSFLLIGFDLEDSQYLLRRKASKAKGLRMSKQLTDLQNKRNVLYCLIQNWRKVQLFYIPHVSSLLLQAQPPEATTTSSSTPLPSEALAENLPLFLPSSLPPCICALPELKGICSLELQLH
ncbi:uncharacterized protein LACBIDRAFT_308170 [Laccaria bicolor S238N-H82]|uniref:Predicted protein n=1 Tax=Laccaria bicolor (strain S238N-H82 / ATCC MYA-4686) TaxID=486041 RepID=B0DRR8_LACBS|nr:uncharacterized protein LACBIDRAFT_308170 [Laccaria bicolor S238N-H82]EDR02656.1 predicted protein [Laccaria bicolor S238N-H82]|eukprot:XP_001886700.1 predicted protein [Laccaria bicolor S238N-H82]